MAEYTLDALFATLVQALIKAASAEPDNASILSVARQLLKDTGYFDNETLDDDEVQKLLASLQIPTDSKISVETN